MMTMKCRIFLLSGSIFIIQDILFAHIRKRISLPTHTDTHIFLFKVHRTSKIFISSTINIQRNTKVLYSLENKSVYSVFLLTIFSCNYPKRDHEIGKNY